MNEKIYVVWNQIDDPYPHLVGIFPSREKAAEEYTEGFSEGCAMGYEWWEQYDFLTEEEYLSQYNERERQGMEAEYEREKKGGEGK